MGTRSNRQKTQLLLIFLLFFGLANFASAASFIDDIVFFTDSVESSVFQSISQYATELERDFRPGFSTGVKVIGKGLSKPEIKKFSHHISIIYKNAGVRGKDFLLPVFLCPIKSIRAFERADNTEIVIELSHAARLVRSRETNLFEVKDVGKELPQIPRPDEKSFTAVRPAEKSFTAVRPAVKSSVQSMSAAFKDMKSTKTTVLKNQESKIVLKAENYASTMKSSDQKLKARLKDIDVVTNKATGVEVRFKFSRIPKYRKMELDEKVVLVFPRIDSDIKTKRIPVDKGGLRVIDVSVGDESVRVVLLLDKNYKVDLLKTKRRLRAFIVEKDRELEVVSKKIETVRRMEEKIKALRPEHTKRKK